jgi:GNAT superfamily N-acetyltransferase
MADSATAPQFLDMTEAHLEGGLRLSRASGWNQTLEDWRLLLSLGPGLFRVAVRDGRVVASGGAARYGDALAWICMILVHPEERGRGLGRRVFDEVLARCRAEQDGGRLRAIGLDATPAGRGLYERRGFAAGPALVRMLLAPDAAPLSESAPAGLRALRPEDLASVLARDRQVFGADREAVLRSALERAPELAWLGLGEGRRVAGYSFGRTGELASHVGPVVADDAALAARLVRACTSGARGRPLTLDARAEPGWVAALGALGFREQRPLTRMYLGEARPPALPAFEPVVFGPEFG